MNKELLVRWVCISLLSCAGMVQAGSISGIVVDPYGNPIAGATVHLNDEVLLDQWQTVDSMQTDAQGQFSFEDISGSVYVDAVLDDVHTQAIPGGYDCRNGCDHEGPYPGPYYPLLDPSEDRVVDPIVLHAAAAIVFHVVRASTGEPVPDPQPASVHPDSGLVAVSNKSSDSSNNTISILHIPVTQGIQNYYGTEIRSYLDGNLLGACADDTPVDAFSFNGSEYPCTNHEIEIYPGIKSDVTIHLVQGNVLKGRLLESATGGPAVNAEVELYKANDHGSRLDSGVDDSGIYRVGPLLPGSYDLLFSHPVYSDLYRSKFYPDTPCDADGCDQLSPSPIAVTGLGNEVRLQDTTIVPRQWIAGRVVDSQTSQPLEHVKMRLMSAFSLIGGYTWALNELTYTNANGEYVFVGIEPDGYTVRALDYVNAHLGQRKPDFVCSVQNSFCSQPEPRVDANGNWIAPYTLGPDTHIEDMNFALEKGAAIHGHVFNRITGGATSDAQIWVGNETGGGITYSDASGNYSSPGLLPVDLIAVAKNMISAQLYQDIDCPSAVDCDHSLGTPIHVNEQQQVSGVDFSLLPETDKLFSSGFDPW